MAGCITKDYQDIIAGLVDKETDKVITLAVLQAIPLCPGAALTAPSQETVAKTRKLPTPWGIEPLYIDKDGKETSFSSPSALLKHLNLPLSGIQCDTEGKKCKATSLVEIFRINGYIVRGNGDEPKKAAEGGKTMTVRHPASMKGKDE